MGEDGPCCWRRWLGRAAAIGTALMQKEWRERGARPSSTESVVASRERRSGLEPRGATHHGHVAQAADDKQRGEEEQDEDDDGQPPVGVVVHAGC